MSDKNVLQETRLIHYKLCSRAQWLHFQEKFHFLNETTPLQSKTLKNSKAKNNIREILDWIVGDRMDTEVKPYHVCGSPSNHEDNTYKSISNKYMQFIAWCNCLSCAKSSKWCLRKNYVVSSINKSVETGKHCLQCKLSSLGKKLLENTMSS